MDIFAHTLWANAGARGANALAEKLDKSRRPEGPGPRPKASGFKISPGWTGFFGVAPDFFAFTIPFFIGIYNLLFNPAFEGGFGSHHIKIDGFDLASYLYQFSHSIVIFALVFILVWVIYKRPRWELFGWLLHILIDIPSHSVQFYPTPFLFPISEYRFPYGVSWANTWYMIINYTALAIVWSTILLKKMRQKKLEKIKL